MNLDPIKHAVQWLEREQRNAEDDCGDPKCDECGVRRARQTIIDGLKLLHDNLSMASKGEHMNREDIIRMAREAGWPASVLHPHGPGVDTSEYLLVPTLERFAALVYEATFRDANIAASRTILNAAVLKEREACAQIADAHASIEGIAQRIAAEIRGQ